MDVMKPPLPLLVALTLTACACGPTLASSARPTLPSVAGSSAPTAATPGVAHSPASPLTFSLLPPAGGAPTGLTTIQITCSGSIGPSDPVAVVQLHDGSNVLRGFADASHPRSVCQFGGHENAGADVHQLIDSRHVVVGGSATYGSPTAKPVVLYAVVDLPEVHYNWFQLPDVAGEFTDFLAIGPGLDRVAWKSHPNASPTTDRIHITTSAGDHVVASLQAEYGRCGSAEDSRSAGYTHTGAHLFALDQDADNSLLVFSNLETQLKVLPPAGGWPQGMRPGMAVWSPASETLFYRQHGDVLKWTPAAGAQTYLAGVNWYYPTISADGGHLAYAVVRPDGLHNVYLVDLAHGGAPRLVGGGARNTPIFLTSNLLWFKSDKQGPCGPGGDQPLIYDLTDGSESPSVVDWVGAVWPATSSNF
jgi:hypothetical protein